jgi:aspartyl-tRNA(Asn)/glutamyl-tRNA(Gln) amidotransferase subunit A
MQRAISTVLEEIHYMPITKLSSLMRDRVVSPIEVTQAFLKRIDQHDKSMNAFITVMADEAEMTAKQVEIDLSNGVYKGPLQGIPIALKDLYFTKGVRTTGGSRILSDFIPSKDSTVTQLLRKAGSIIIGKTNMHEFAFGVTNLNPHYGPCLNPWNENHIPGGSSGGSGAAVITGLCSAAMGSDTGGSIRIPAALCGTVGLKPTYGRVSRNGLIPLSWSLDHAGPLTRTVQDAAIILQAIAGHDPEDESTSQLPVPSFLENLDGGVEGLRIGVPVSPFFEELDPGVKKTIEKAITHLSSLGAQIEEVSIPHIQEAASVFLAILLPEAYNYHLQYLGTRSEDYGADVRDRVSVAALVSAADFVQAQRVRRLLKLEMATVLTKVDALITPTVPIPAPRVDAFRISESPKALSTRNALSRFTSPFNLVGLPALSVPCGLTDNQLPVGLQIVGRPYEEQTIIRIGHTYESTTEWHSLRPPGF